MSEENAEQIKTIITSFWNNALRNIAASRDMTLSGLQQAADEFSGRDAQLALQAGLVDSLAYSDEVNRFIREKSGNADKKSAPLVPLKKYNKVHVKGLTEFSKDKIALIYANGDIVSGEGNENQIGSDRIAGTVRKARLDSTCRAIVLRVNSGGGSAMASDVIWREVALARQVKPVVVSMGDYAASGGYYIACAADSIVAQANTLTGSIGVFGLLINAKEMFNEKLGITFDTEKTARYADLGTISRSLSADERSLIQMQVEKVYDTFISHVAESRKVSKEYVDSIGQGRIWSGEDALRLGLVDAIGGVDRAISIAAGMAGLEKYRIVQLPEQKEIFAKILEDLNAEAATWFAKRELGEHYRYYETLKTLTGNQGIQARIPVRPEFY
jgi:protease-4